MEPSLDFFTPTDTEDTPKTVSKPTLLMVTLNHEMVELVRLILGTDFTYIETDHFEKATFLTRFEPIHIAVIGMTSKQLSTGNTLDLILNLLDQKKDISIYLYVDSLKSKRLQSYIDLGIINYLSTASHPFALLNQLGTSFGKKGWEKNLKHLPEKSSPDVSIDSTKQPWLETIFPPPNKEVEFSPSPVVKEEAPFYNTPQRETKQLALNPAPLKKLSLDLAHKIKNPLVSIKTFTELLNQNFDDPHFRKDFYPLVKSEIGKINQTIETLLDYAEQLHSHPKWVDYSELLEEQVNSFNEHEKNFVMLLAIKEGLPNISIEESQGRLAHKLLIAIFSEIRKGNDHLTIEMRKVPPDGLEVTWSLPFPHPVDTGIQGLEYTLVEWIFDSLQGKFYNETKQNIFLIRYVLFPSDLRIETTPKRLAVFPPRGRRREQFPIAFLDRRKTERRHRMVPILFKERRIFFAKGSEI